MTTQVGDIAIQKVRVKASGTDAQAYIRDLENSTWNPPGERQWLFVRSLRVLGRKHELRQRTHLALDSARRGAVHGGSSAAAQANAVCFASLAELLAFLIRDLLHGDTPFRWYWQQWSYLLHDSVSNAITRLFWEHSEVLPQVVVHLDALHCLDATWLALEPAAAQRLLVRIQERLVCPTSDRGLVASIESQTRIRTTLTPLLGRLPSEQRRWDRVFARLPEDDARVALAVAILGLSHFPVLLAQSPAELARVFYQLMQSSHRAQRWFESHAENPLADLTPSPTSALEPNPSSPERRAGTNPDVSAKTLSNPISATSATHPAVKAEDYASAYTEHQIVTVSRTSSQLSKAASISAPSSTTGRPLAPDEMNVPVRDAAEAMPANADTIFRGGEFYTAWGGTLYLLNALRSVQSTLLDLSSASRPGAGFYWLYETLRRFERPVDRFLLRYLAQQMGFKDEHELLSLNPDPEFAPVFARLQRRFANVWRADLLQVPAVVIHTASHIDALLPLASVKVPVRLHGLDVNPGWLPWLGRVVAFHYRSGIPQSVQEYDHGRS